MPSPVRSAHGPTLQGGAHGPALSGVSFSSVWGTRSPAELFEYVRSEMPPGEAGSLGDAVYRKRTDAGRGPGRRPRRRPALAPIRREDGRGGSGTGRRAGSPQ